MSDATLSQGGPSGISRRAWVMIITGALIVTLSMGVRQAFGLFLRPIGLDLEIDRQTLLGGVRFTRRIIEAKAMDRIRGAELQPGPQVQSDDEMLSWIRETADTAYHPTCTCKMGQDELSVVDAQLRVHGLEGLRIADGSIMPTLISGNTNAACIMIGEKASDMILAA